MLHREPWNTFGPGVISILYLLRYMLFIDTVTTFPSLYCRRDVDTVYFIVSYFGFKMLATIYHTDFETY